MKRTMVKRALVPLLGLLRAGIAQAGTPAGGEAAANAIPQPPSSSVRVQPQLHVLAPPGGGLEPGPSSGPLSGLGDALAEDGIYLRALMVNEYASNVTGGQGRGVGDSLATPFGLDVDTGRLFGIPGGELHLTINKSIGNSLSVNDTKNAISYQARAKNYHNFRLAALLYEQKLFNDTVTITGGRLSALTLFSVSTIYCEFQNNTFCFNGTALPLQDGALSFFPYDTWGGRMKVLPTPRFYVQIGAFESDTALNTGSGFNFTDQGATGVQGAAEIGMQSPTGLAPHAYHIQLGVYRNTSPVADPYFNAHLLSRVQYKGSALMHDGQDGGYVSGDVVLFRLGRRRLRNVTLFGGLYTEEPQYVTFKNQATVGVVATGPLAARPDDTLGLAATYLTLGNREIAFLQASRAAVGGTDRVKKDEAIIELNYGFKITRGIRLNPNLQYVVNPDNVLKPAAADQSRNILAFGVRLSVELGSVLGLPAWSGA